MVIRPGLWRKPARETFSFQGEHYQLTDSTALPKPVQTPTPPVIIGGFGPKRTPALAARFADEFNAAFGDLDTAIPQFGRVDAACQAIGRGPTYLSRAGAL